MVCTNIILVQKFYLYDIQTCCSKCKMHKFIIGDRELRDLKLD